MDITSVSSYSEMNEFVSYGYNRDKENSAGQSPDGQRTYKPSSFILQGYAWGIHDVSTMDESLKRFDLVDAKRLHMVMDKGFTARISGCHVQKAYAVSGWRSVYDILSLDAAERHRNDEMVSYRHYCNVLGEELYADTELIKWKGHRCYLHVYFDSIKRRG